MPQSVPHPAASASGLALAPGGVAGRPGPKRPRRRRQALVVAALCGGLLATTPGAARAETTDPAPAGRAASQGAPVIPAAVAAQATVSVTCQAAEAFSRVGSGALYRMVDSAPASGNANTMTGEKQVGSGWKTSAFAWIAAGGDGVVYALTWSGQLKWYRYTGTRWATGSGRTVGTGFVPRKRIINIALGANGNFYVVRKNRQLAIYRHSGRLTGQPTWGSSRGSTIGTGWTANEILIPNGDGTLYRQYAGKLYWYRHTTSGRVRWARPKVIGTGWKFYDVLPAGAGVLYTTQSGSGAVTVYRHADPVGGSAGWAASRGVRKGTVRADSYGIAVDPGACTIS